MTRRDVLTVFAVEYALTGVASALVGLSAGSGLAWVVIARVLEVPWAPRAAELAVAAVTVVVLAVAAGLSASANALSVRPAAVLRSE
jgi:putative ABC transport system permease protein